MLEALEADIEISKKGECNDCIEYTNDVNDIMTTLKYFNRDVRRPC